MRKRLKRIPIFSPNKHELYVSFLVLLFCSPYMFGAPGDYQSSLTAAGAFSTAFLLTLNAVLDIKRMHWVERILAVPWFCLLAYVTPHLIWDIAQIGAFADK